MAHTFNQEWAVRLVGSPAVWANSYVYTDWVAIAGHRRVVFLVGNAELDGDMALAIHQHLAACHMQSRRDEIDGAVIGGIFRHFSVDEC